MKLNTNLEHYTWGNTCDGWHLHKSEELNVIKERMPQGTSEVLHFHEFAQQVFYILSGTAVFEINGQTRIVKSDESIHIPPKTLHRILNQNRDDLEFILVSQPMAQGDRVDFIDYNPELKESIKTLNVEWLEKYFYVEPNDVIQLSNPQTQILDKGGFIYYARRNNEIVGTASLLYETDDIYELGKMAVTEKAQGHSIGTILMEHCFNQARQKGIKKLILYSNTKLESAIHLYKKYGFKEIYLEEGRYKRSNIKMEKVL